MDLNLTDFMNIKSALPLYPAVVIPEDVKEVNIHLLLMSGCQQLKLHNILSVTFNASSPDGFLYDLRLNVISNETNEFDRKSVRYSDIDYGDHFSLSKLRYTIITDLHLDKNNKKYVLAVGEKGDVLKFVFIEDSYLSLSIIIDAIFNPGNTSLDNDFIYNRILKKYNIYDLFIGEKLKDIKFKIHRVNKKYLLMSILKIDDDTSINFAFGCDGITVRNVNKIRKNIEKYDFDNSYYFENPIKFTHTVIKTLFKSFYINDKLDNIEYDRFYFKCARQSLEENVYFISLDYIAIEAVRYYITDKLNKSIGVDNIKLSYII